MIRRILVSLIVAALGYLYLAIVALNLLRVMNPPFTMVQAQRWAEARLSGEAYAHKQMILPLESIPVVLQRAVIAAEDGRFYDHDGVDWLELRKVLDEASEGDRLRGASTITQQLVKNLFFTTHGNPLRKPFEYVLAPAAEVSLGKERILELYLNEIEWGPGIWGAEAAARHHYGISASAVSRDQAARLAACIPLPKRRKPQQMNQYSEIIQERMAARGW